MPFKRTHIKYFEMSFHSEMDVLMLNLIPFCWMFVFPNIFEWMINIFNFYLRMLETILIFWLFDPCHFHSIYWMVLYLLIASISRVLLPIYPLMPHKIIYGSFQVICTEECHNRIYTNENHRNLLPNQNHIFSELQIARQYFLVLCLDG